ncbi:MAG: hypothetical protein ACP5QW_00725 [bacterium]
MKTFKIVALMLLLIGNPAILFAEENGNGVPSVISIPSSSLISSEPASSTQGNNNTVLQPVILNSNTYLSAYGLNINNTDNDYLPFYEDLNFKYPVLDNTLSVEGAGWLRYDFLTMPYNGRTNADFTYAYLNYTPKDIPLRLKLGRIYSWFGVANDQYDGMELMLNNIYGLGLDAFIGSEVDSQLHNTPGGVTTGGRLSYNNSIFGIGGSMFYSSNDDWISQERWGVDAWIRPVNILYLFGRYYYDMVDKRAYDGTAKISITPINRLFVDGEYSLFNPASLIDKTSIFWVFSTESYRNLKADMGYRILDNLSLAIEGTKYMYSTYGNSYSYGAKINYDKRPYALGLELDKVDSTPTDYLTTRIYAFRNFAMGFYANIDIIYSSYLGELNGYNHSITGHVAVGKEIINKLKLTLSGDTLDGPYVRHGGYGMLSLKYSL